MNTVLRRLSWMLALLSALLLLPAICVGNDVMGELDLEGASHVARTSGVWIDGQYVGYLKELKGDKKVLLLPGDHTITVRQDGYQPFLATVHIVPGQTREVRVAMLRSPKTPPMPARLATVKINVSPSRAAVFMDGQFAGHVGEFKGFKGMLIAPGSHQIVIALPGYQPFATVINPIADQTVEIKTDLVHNDAPLSGLLLEKHAPGPATAAPAMAAPEH
jgi:PEGA domain